MTDRLRSRRTCHAVPGSNQRFMEKAQGLEADEIFLDLLDWPRTFPKVWGLLGWNVQLYHSHMTVTPVVPLEERPAKKRLGWHQDSGRLNQEMETEPRPRISLRTTTSVSVAFKTFIRSVSQNTAGVFLPKCKPRKVTVSFSTSTNAASTTSCFQRSKSSKRLCDACAFTS